MAPDISKRCADFLRRWHRDTHGEKLKASHARELAAALFGYKSHAAQNAEVEYPLSRLEDAAVLVPDIPLMDARRRQLNGLPGSLPPSHEIATALCRFLEDESLYGGEIWIYDSLENYVREEFLYEKDHQILDELSGVMAETNAQFEEAIYEEASVSENDEEVTVDISGTYHGSNDPDKPFCGDKITMSIVLTLPRIAGRRGFGHAELSVTGAVDDDWVDPEFRFDPAAE